ncbi:MAG: helix-turn-helix domain-containing protein [Victivallaceae bacterium]
MAKLTGCYKKNTFFERDFPFFFKREIDRPEEFNENTRFKREFWKIIYIAGGRGEKIINDRRYPIRPGSVLLIHPNDETTYVIDGPGLEICNILFMPEFVARELGELEDDFNFFAVMEWNLPPGANSDERLHVFDGSREIRRIVRTMEQEYRQMPPNYRARLRWLLLELLILLGRNSNRRARHRAGAAVAGYIDRQIELHFARSLTLDELEAKTHIAKSRLCRLYRAAANRTIMDALRQKRLDHAAALLRATSRTVSQICFDSGFNDLSCFYRCFFRRYGCNPTVYREK